MQGGAGGPSARESGRPRAPAYGPGKRHIVQFSDFTRAPQQETAPTHVPATHELGGKVKASPECLFQDSGVLLGGDASEKDDPVRFAEPAAQAARIPGERGL